MEVSALKIMIANKGIPNYLIFTGPEWKVQEIYINQIAKVKNANIVRLDSYREVYSRLRSKAFLSPCNVFVVRDDTDIQTNDKITLQSIVDALKDNVFIHILTVADKRKKYYKDNQKRIVDFQPLVPNILKKYIKREIDLSDRNCDILMEICEYSYGRCLLEIDKIKRFAQAHPEEFDDVGFDTYFEKLLEDGTIYEPPYDAIFDLVDAILDRKPQKTFDLLQQSYESGEATMVMLSVLYNNAKSLLQVQAYEGNNLAKASGLSGWEIKNAKKHLNKYSVQELIRMVQRIQSVEIGIKTGKIEDEFAMEYLLCGIL